MQPINIPSGTIIVPPQPFYRESVEQILEELCAPGHEFSGFVKVVSDTAVYLLFFFRSRPYAAAKTARGKLGTLPLRTFFNKLAPLESSSTQLSIHSADPVLLKSLLVFFQNPPTVKAPARQLNLNAIIAQIRKESADAMITLQSRHELSLFFFKHGEQALSYSSLPGYTHESGITIEQQLQNSIALHGDGAAAAIYRNTATTEDSEALVLSQSEMLSLLHGEYKTGNPKENLVLRVIEGARKGEVLAGPIPCVLGRKDTDIIISDPLTSKRHAAIQVVNGSLLLLDLNSTNGTFVNGRRVKQHGLTTGDTIMLGETIMIVEKLRIPS